MHLTPLIASYAQMNTLIAWIVPIRIAPSVMMATMKLMARVIVVCLHTMNLNVWPVLPVNAPTVHTDITHLAQLATRVTLFMNIV